MQLKDVMKKHVAVVAPDTPLREAAQKMNAAGVGLLPVCEGLSVVGLLTSRDIAVRATARGCDARSGRVREVMMAPAICGRENQNVNEAAALMQRWRLYGLPVVDRGLQLAGIVFLRDLRGNARGARRATSRWNRRKRTKPARKST